MLRIAQICNRPQGSVGDIVRSSTNCMAKAGYSVTVIFLKGRDDDLPAANLNCEIISCADWFDKGSHKEVIQRLRSLFRQKNFDVVIAHRYHPSKFAMQASRGLVIKRKIAVFHGLANFKRWRRKLFAWFFLRTWLIAGVSKAVARDILESGAGFRSRQVHVVSNGIDLKALEASQLNRAEARAHLGLPPDAFIFGNVGRLSTSKNQSLLIKAYKKIVEDLPLSRLVLVGEGRKKGELLSLVTEYDLQDKVLFTGYLPKAHLYLRAFDVFLFPSRYEAFGLALLEAMIARVPVIVSDVGGISELVGPYPFKINPHDAETLAANMLSMASITAPEREIIANRLHARASADYDINRLEEAYLKIIALPS